MQFGHEKLDVYRLSIDYVAWAYGVAKNLSGVDRHARDQLLRASQSIPLNIAEGNGKGTNADRRRFFEIARGSAMECSAIQDCLISCEVLSYDQSSIGRAMLNRIVSMLTKLGVAGKYPRLWYRQRQRQRQRQRVTMLRPTPNFHGKLP